MASGDSFQESNDSFSIILSQSEIIDIIVKADSSINPKELKIVSHKISPFETEIFGLSGDYFQLSVVISVNESEHDIRNFFIKTLPLRNPLDRNRVTTYGLFDREKDIYTNVFNEFKNPSTVKWHPECYFSNSDLIVMEDITIQGYKNVASMSLSADQAKECLKHISAMHADSIIYEIQSGHKFQDLCSETLSESSIKRYDPWIETGLLAIKTAALKDNRNQSAKRLEFIKDDLLTNLDIIFDLLQIPNNVHKTFCHSNICPKNIFLKVDETDTKCILVDYQKVQYLPPAVDVLIFLYFNLGQEAQTESDFNEFSKFYYQSLTENCRNSNIEIENILTWDEFQTTFDQYKILAIVLKSLTAPFICDPKYVIELRKFNPDKYIECMSEDRNEMIEHLCGSSEEFKNFIFESNQAVIEYFNPSDLNIEE